MAKHTSTSPPEAADRLAIRELVEAYAHCADRRDAEAQMALFTADAHFVVYMNAKDPTPSMELHSRDALAPVFADLNQYEATTHFVGQSTILTLSEDRATGEAYCLARHLSAKEGHRRLMIVCSATTTPFRRSPACGSLPRGSFTSTGSTSGRSHNRRPARADSQASPRRRTKCAA